jgi:hypothetical protein
MTYSLTKEGNGSIGDSGLMSIFIYEKDGNVEYEDNARPRVGGVMRVGSHYTRSYQNQDYWQTSMITEILEETDDTVKFKTLNSIYTWKEHI